MPMDKNEFFREATLRICGNLEIEDAMFSTLQYLRQIMPVNRMAIEHYEEKSNSMRTIAVANSKGGKNVDLLTPLSDGAQNHAEKKYHIEEKKVFLFEEPEKDILAREMLQFHGIKATSLLVLVLESGNKRLGTLVLMTESDNRFSQEHADLIFLLSKPFAIALSNTLKHRNEIRLYEKDFFWEMTKRICGNLDIEKSMHSSLQYLNQVMPASRMFLEQYDASIQSTRTIGIANLKEGKSIDLLTPLSPEAQKWASGYQKGELKGVYFFTDPDSRPYASMMMKFHKVSLSSVILLPLESGGVVTGSLILGSEGDEKFTQEHADLISQLSEPFAIAMSNTVKHRNELRLFDRDFFWEVTMRICGNLEIEEGLKECFEYISQHIPADTLYLEKYESELGSNRIIACANADKAEALDILIPLPEQSREVIDERIQALKDGTAPPVIVYNEPDMVRDYILNYLGEPSSSVMGLPLVIKGQVAGALTVIAKGNNRFEEYHEKLFSTLKIPFFVAMSNTLKHRNELRLFDRDFFWEVTIRICGNLEIEEGLRECRKYISQHMPADSLYLLKYESNLGSNRVIARANAEKGEALNILIPLPEQLKEDADKITQTFQDGASPTVTIYNEPNTLRNYMLDYLGEPSSSVMGLPLVIEGQFAGALTVIAEGNNRFEEHHEKLFSTLQIPFFVAMSNTLKHHEILHLKDMLVDDNRFLQTELKNKSGENIIGSNFGLKGVMEMVRQVADLDSPVMLLGETGTGKDLVANTIHYSSSRRDGPFISVNCGAIPESLIDSELFGHEKGAFTGALSQKRGRFERANKGTIFLDEVGELPLQAQVRLLRVLQNKEIERVGGTKTIDLDIRVIAATNRDIEGMVRDNKFREDLWFRLNVFPITLPPLRERKSDIPALLQHFILQKTKDLKLPSIPEPEPGSIDILMEYSWPGNVREVDNVVERALILSKGGPLNFKHLQQSGKKQENFVRNDTDNEDNLKSIDEIVSRHIEKVLSKTRGKIHGPGGAAEILGINASTLRNRMNKLGISYRKNEG